MNNKKARIAVCVLLAIAIATVSFVAGFLTHKCSANKLISSYEWALKTIRDNYYFGEPDVGYTETGVSSIVAKYLDRYSAYYTKEQYEEVKNSNAGSKSGVGISYGYADGKGIFISRVVGNSPAYLGERVDKGLRAGEWITSGRVDGGEEVTFTSQSSFTEFMSPVADGVNITLTSADGTKYTMAKARYTASYTSLSFASSGWAFRDSADGGLALYEESSLALPYLPDGCAYLKLDQFYGTAAGEFYSLIEKFNAENCTSLILDLRSNGGGYVSVMQELAGCFSDGETKLAMLARDKRGKEDRYNCKKIDKESRRISKDVKVFVLANAGTASASEALIGAMYCYGALSYENIFLSQYSEEYLHWLYPSGKGVKNACTYGKGIMQTPFTNYMTGEVLKLTTAKIFWPDEVTSIHDVGVTLANGCTPVPAEWEWTKDDEELKSAVGIIKTRLGA